MVSIDLGYALDVLRYASHGGPRSRVPDSARETLAVLVELGWVDQTEQWTESSPVTLSLSRAGQVALALALRRV
jgi:hypothetical protein